MLNWRDVETQYKKPPELIRWAIPNGGHLPVEVRLTLVREGDPTSRFSTEREDEYSCDEVATGKHLYTTTLKYVFLTEREALQEAHQRQEERAFRELRKFDEVCIRLGQIVDAEVTGR